MYIIRLVRWLDWVFDTHEQQKDRSLRIISIPIPQSTINIQIHYFKTTFHILNTLPTYKYTHFKTTFMCPSPRSIAGVPSSQALTGYLITAHHLFAFLMLFARFLVVAKPKKKWKYSHFGCVGGWWVKYWYWQERKAVTWLEVVDQEHLGEVTVVDWVKVRMVDLSKLISHINFSLRAVPSPIQT